MIISGRANRRAISPVVGVVLMVAVTVIMAAVIGAFVFDFATLQDPSGLASVSIDETGDDRVTVQAVSMDVDSLIVTNGDDEYRIESVGESVETHYGLSDQITVLGEVDGERTVIQSEKKQGYDSRVYVTSRSGDRTPRTTYVIHDGFRYSTARGTVVLELTPDGDFVSYGSYDTHGGDRYWYGDTLDGNGDPDVNRYTDCADDYCNDKLLPHLDAISEENIVIFTVRDQADGMSDDVYDRLHSEYGSAFKTGENELGYRDTWIMVSKKGVGAMYERTEARGNTSGIYDIKHTVYLPSSGSYTTHDD